MRHQFERIYNIDVEGDSVRRAHSDDLGEEQFNLALSEKRAGSVKNYLISKDISERSIRVKGYGETDPLFPNDSDENRAKNRRVEFTIIRK